MEERISRTLAKVHGLDPDLPMSGRRHLVEHNGVTTIVCEQSGPAWMLWIADARAVIKGMGDPTPDMVMDLHGISPSKAILLWRAMISKASPQ